ncbi:PGAP1-like alpha/beta domain-containing protein [Microcoleus sp. Pol12B5]|uniref:PGAP1-like alpha/beta domain-containing protein n=1 Tax=Microcoleus sp. Pol12B5 TaxID=3055396 RepID=UPI002FD1BCA6
MKVVGIHGIFHEYLSSAQIENDWLLALQGGLDEAGVPRIERQDFTAVSYGSLFRPSGRRSAGVPKFSAQDVEEGWEQELLIAWWREAAALSQANKSDDDPLGEDPSIQGPDFQGRGRTPAVVQRALKQLAKLKFFKAAGVSERLLIFGLKQVRQFLHDSEMKQAILQRVSEKVSTNTRVIIGHSLGSIVAYEALCEHPEWNVDTLVTLGSPLGIPGLIFDSLTPKPENGTGAWPNVKNWFNIADKGDIVALEKELAPHFGDVVDRLVYNGWESHSAERYLTARETGQAVATGLFD